MNGTGTSNFWCLHVGILIIHTIFYLYGFHDVVVQCCLHGLLSINFRSCTDGIASDIKKLLSIGIFRIHSWFGLCGLCFLPISLGFLTLRPSTFSSKFQLIRSKSFSLGFPSFGVLIVSKVTCMYSFVLVVVWCCLGGFRLLLVSLCYSTSHISILPSLYEASRTWSHCCWHWILHMWSFCCHSMICFWGKEVGWVGFCFGEKATTISCEGRKIT